jgi:hypothetical protein
MTRDGPGSTMGVSSPTRRTARWRHGTRRRQDAITLGWTGTHQPHAVLLSVSANKFATSPSMMATGPGREGSVRKGRGRRAHGSSGRMEIEDWKSVNGFACGARLCT